MLTRPTTRTTPRRGGLLTALVMVASLIGGLQAPPAEAGGSVVEIILVVDETASMGLEHTAISSDTAALEQAAADAGITPSFGVLGFGGPIGHEGTSADGEPHVHHAADGTDSWKAALSEFDTSGTVEPGYDALVLATTGDAGNGEALGRCVLIFTDEPSNGNANTLQTTQNAIFGTRTRVFPIVSVSGGVNTVNSYQELATRDASGQPQMFVREDGEVVSGAALAIEACAATFSSLSIDDVTVSEGAPATFTVSALSPAPYDITVGVTTSDGTATAGDDYTALPPTTITIPAGATEVTVEVDTLPDTVQESGETFTVELANPSGATLSDALGAGTISDATVGCGNVVTGNIVLPANLGPCPGHGLLVGARNTTINLAGHSIRGLGGGVGIGVAPGADASGAVVRNGTITKFGRGVLLTGDGRIKVSRLKVMRNNAQGIFAKTSKKAVLNANRVGHNGTHGIQVKANTAAIRGNVAEKNAKLGITAPNKPGIKGSNTARGNNSGGRQCRPKRLC